MIENSKFLIKVGHEAKCIILLTTKGQGATAIYK